MNILETLKSFFKKKPDSIKRDYGTIVNESGEQIREDFINSLKNNNLSPFIKELTLKALKTSLDDPNISPKQREEIIKLTKDFEVEPIVRKSFNDNKN